MYAGGVYCSLNPTEPSERLAVLLEQMQGQYVLVHMKTRNEFPSSAVRHIILLDDVLRPSFSVEDMDDLPICSGWGPAYIIFTSGTTGRPKIIVHTHRSFSACINAYVHWDLGVYTIRDLVLQVATCSWVLHLLEIPLALVVGGGLVLLRPGGHMDMAYFSRTLIRQQVTTLTIGPSIIRALTDYLEMSRRFEALKFVRNLCITGEAIKSEQLARFHDFLSSSSAQVCLLYGMSECNTAIGCRLVDINDTIIPLGYPLPNVRCLLIDEQGHLLNNVHNPSEIGQIYIGGLTPFNCYLNDPERTANTFITIDNQVYMKTGDLARYNARGEFVHAGRIDFQIKIRGQRVETIEIENTIINWSRNKISHCLVTKHPQNDDLLIAYIISNDFELDIGEIRDYCNKYLRQYMVPSYFVILDKFPLNVNGKVDRKQLPLPSLRYDIPNECNLIENQPMSELEKKIHNLWCSTLKLDVIPRYINYFALGGSSLSLIQLFNYYQFYFAPDKELNVIDFFTIPTVTKHVKLLTNSQTKTNTVWNPLHLVQGPASYAQESIWLAEQTRFIQQTPSVSPYNLTNIYHIDSGLFSIKRCLETIDFIVTRHTVFRTRLRFNTERRYLEQSIIETKSFDRRPYQVLISTVQNEQECKALTFKETIMSLDDCVFRCHFIRYNHTNKDTLKQGDFVIFTFYHGVFDGTAVRLVLNEFIQVYSGNYNLQTPGLQYIDYSTYERSDMDMNAAKDYWREALQGYSWDRQLDLHYDFGVPINARRSGRCWSVLTDMPSEISEAILNRAKELHVTLLQLMLTCFYIFLAQLSPYNQDVCVATAIENRYRPELENMIGMLANILPCRVTFDASSTSTVTFIDLLHKVQNNLANMIQYGYMPYLELLELHRLPSSNLQSPFLHAYLSVFTSMDRMYLDTNQLNLISSSSNQENCSLSEYKEVTVPEDENIFAFPNMFDIDLTFHINIEKKEIKFWFDYSTDLFTYTTINMLAKRFTCLFADLFVSTSLQQLKTTPLVKLISMAKEPINREINKHQKQLDQSTKILTPLEEHIKAIYSRVLETEHIDINRSFFEQGGTSMKALQAIYLLQENPMTTTVDANLFFATHSVIQLAQTIEASHL